MVKIDLLGGPAAILADVLIVGVMLNHRHAGTVQTSENGVGHGGLAGSRTSGDADDERVHERA